MIFRVAQGSGTVAGMTSMGIIAAIAPAIGCHPSNGSRWPACPAATPSAMSMTPASGGHQYVGLTVTGGLKTYTLGSFISSVCIFVLALIGAW
ncbi:MAG: hypothetical protein ACLU38_08160 [Dysosmobacter sp.]